MRTPLGAKVGESGKPFAGNIAEQNRPALRSQFFNSVSEKLPVLGQSFKLN
jgi:hypothetical protein